MTATLAVKIDGWAHGEAIPEKFAFGVPAADAPMTFGPNRNPRINWSGAPAGTRSYAIICHDPDVPSVADDVNREGVSIPASLPRVDFYHWVLVDIPPSITEIPEGGDSDGVTVGGKPAGKTSHGVRGLNTYTDFLAGNTDLKGKYAGYDGPCPPWNDTLLHHYHFTVYALDVPSLDLGEEFGGAEALKAMEGHVLAQGTWMGTYSLNPAVRGA